jgi:hypothetical protein
MDIYDSIQFRWIEINELPLFNEDFEKGGAPETVTSFKSSIQGVDGIMIVSPVYFWNSRRIKKSIRLGIDTSRILCYEQKTGWINWSNSRD